MKRFFLISIILSFVFPFGVLADSGSSTIVMDIDSGRVLYQKNIHTKRLIASITKIMTCIVILENVDIKKEVKVSDEVLKMYGTNIYIEVGEVLTIEDLLYGLMLRSGNDAAMTLAVSVSGSEEKFVQLMNQKAKEIGMTDTSFSNPHGLDDDTKNYSTAYDMMLLSQYAYQNSTYRKIVSTKRYETQSNFKGYLWHNRMLLINNYKYCVGGKNGYTPSAGKTLVSYAKKGDFTLSIVSLNDSDIYDNHENLYEDYFENYNLYKIVDKNNFFIDPSFFNQEVFLKESFSYPLRDDELKDVSTLIEINTQTKDQALGRVVIKLKNKEIANLDIYGKETKKEEKSLFQKIWGLFTR